MKKKPYDEITTQLFSLIQGFKDFESKPRFYGTEDLLYGSEIHTLQMIGRQGSCNLTQLAGLLEISKSGISKFSNKLLEKGLIIKSRMDKNRKEVIFSLTPKGRIAYLAHEKFDETMFAAMYSLLDSCTKEQIDFLAAFFSRVVKQLQELNQVDI